MLDSLPDSTLVVVESLGNTAIEADIEYLESTYYKLDGYLQRDDLEYSSSPDHPVKVLLIK